MLSATCTHSKLFDIDNARESIHDSVERTLDTVRSSQHPCLLSLSYPIDDINVLQWLKETVPVQEAAFYWEYSLNEIKLAAHTPVLQFTAEGNGRFERIEEEFEVWKKCSFSYDLNTQSVQPLLHLLGAFSFFDNFYSEEWTDFSPAYWFIPKFLMRHEKETSSLILTERIEPDSSFDELYNFFTDIESSFESYEGPIEDRLNSYGKNSSNHVPSQIGTAGYKQPSNGSEYNKWKQNVNKAQKAIRSNELDKIVLSRSVSYEFQNEIDPFKVVGNLRSNYPNCYTFLLKNEKNQYFIGSTPELLTTFNSDRLYTESLAGSTRRGINKSEEKQLEDYLFSSHKEQAEHRFVVNAISTALQPHVKDVEQSPQPTIRKLHNVQHLLTTFQGSLKNGSRPFSILRDLHPTPAVGGSPTEGIKERIRNLEFTDRGLYSGPIGWINEMNQGTFAVAIRCGLIHKNKARLYAGCGIVEDSVSEREWEEAKLKLKPMENALHDT